MSQVPLRSPEHEAEQAALADVRAYVFGPFRLDLVELQLLQGQEVIPLTGKAFDTLVALVRNRHRTVSKEDLIRAVWHDTFVSEESLTQAIYVLRRALGDDSSKPQFIATIARRGYRFVAPVTEIPAEPPAPAPVENPVASAQAPAAIEAPVPLVRASSRGGRLAIALATIAVVAAAIAVAVAFMRDAPTPMRVRFAETAPPGTTLISGAVVSPDSRRIAFVARDNDSGRAHLWIKTLDTGEIAALEGTDGAGRPFWSPDSTALAFFAGGRLKIADLEDGPVRSIAAAGVTPSGGTWNRDGLILFSDITSVIFSVPAAGGPVRPVSALDATGRETAHRRPQFLPDGRHYLFSVASPDPEWAGTYVGELGSADRTRVLAQAVVFAPPDRVLFGRDGMLVSQRLDLETFGLIGAPEPVAMNVTMPSAINSAAISGSDGGVLTFGGGTASEHLAWFDRSGRRLDLIESPAKLHDPVLSVDGTQLFAESAIPDSRGIWRVDIDRGSATRLVNDGTMATMSPDGTLIAYSANRPTGSGFNDLYLRSANDDNRDEPLLVSGQNKYIGDWSADGRLVFVSNAGTNTDLWVLVPGRKDAKPLLQTAANEIQPSISPDGRWIAYASDESGAWEVYVQAFPGLGQKRAISVGGGVEPLWSRDGRELFYLGSDDTLTAVAVSGGPVLAVGQPQALFRAPISSNAPLYRSFYRRHYAASRDGTRFAVAAVDPEGSNPPTVMVNWLSPVTP